MGASSVTGTGKGSVEKYGGGKGPGNLRTNSVPMMTPHVVAAGTSATTGENHTALVLLSTLLPLTAANYSVVVTPVSPVLVGVVKLDSDDQMVGFGVTTGSNVAFDWAIVRAGQGLETQVNWVPEEGNSVLVE